MKQLVSRIDPDTGERVNVLEDMTPKQIAALEASRAESIQIEADREAAEIAKFEAMAAKLGFVKKK